EDVDDLALTFALFGDYLDAVAAGEGGEVGGLDIAQAGQGRAAREGEQLVDQQGGGDLDEADVGALQVGEIEVEGLDLVDGEAEAEVGQLGHVAGLDGAAGVEGGLSQLEDQRLVEVAVLAEEMQELREEGLVAQRR